MRTLFFRPSAASSSVKSLAVLLDASTTPFFDTVMPMWSSTSLYVSGVPSLAEAVPSVSARR